MSSSDTVTTKQHIAIAAMLEGNNHDAVAAAAGISPRQLVRWKQQPAFRQALAAAEAALVEDAQRRLLRLQDTAILTIARIMVDPAAADGVKVRSAVAILDNLFRYRELTTLEQRIAALEAEREEKLDEPLDET